MTGKRIARRLPQKPEREQLPEHMRSKMTLREFKQVKRKQARAVEKAMHLLLMGSAYMPRVEGVALGRMYEQIRTARSEWAKWWRKA